MKIDQMKAGKKYFYPFATHARDGKTGLRVRQQNEVFVLEIDRPKARVLASINGAPAKWYNKEQYRNWTAEPITEPVK